MIKIKEQRIIGEQRKFKQDFSEVCCTDETKKGEECVIYNLKVGERYRNLGIGSSLIHWALDYIRQCGYAKAFVVVKELPLIYFYKKLGFKIVNVYKDRVEMYYYFKKETTNECK